MHKWIESRIFELKALGKQKTKRGLADALGLPDSRVPAIIAGTRKLSFKDVMGIAAYLELSFIDVAENFGVYPGAFGRGVVPVVGYVGAGSEVFPIDDHAQGDGLELVPHPAGMTNQDMVAARIRGDSMYPMMRDGWLVFYIRHQIGVD